jgi:hypothetical protein
MAMLFNEAREGAVGVGVGELQTRTFSGRQACPR